MKRFSIESLLPVSIIFLLIVFFGVGAWFVFGDLDSGHLPGQNVSAYDFQGRSIELPYTDDNSGEDLIIYSDKQDYNEFSGTDVYFSVTPLRKNAESIALQFLISDQDATVEELYKKTADGWEKLPLESQLIAKTDDLAEAWSKRKTIEGDFPSSSRSTYQSSGQTEYFAARIYYPPKTSGQFLIEAFGSGGSYGILDPWYNSSWGFRKEIAIDPFKVSGTSGHTNFPMLFSVTDPDLRDTGSGGGVASSTAGDILFVDWEGNKIDHEIEKYTNTTGEFLAWVEMPFVSSTSTRTIHIYYGNASATYQPTNEATWSSSFGGVWHLGEGSTTASLDSTSNNNDCALSNLTSTTGRLGASLDFNGTTSQADCGTGLDALTTTAVTMSAWVDADTFGEGGVGGIINKAATGPTISWSFAFNTTLDNLTFLQQNTTGGPDRFETPTNSIAPPTGWMYVAGTMQSCMSCTAQLYFNGSPVTTTKTVDNAGTPRADATHNLGIGSRIDGLITFDGRIDEVRITTSVRSDDWIKTEYNNQSSPGSFYAYGGESVENRPAATPSVKGRGGVNERGGVKFR